MNRFHLQRARRLMTELTSSTSKGSTTFELRITSLEDFVKFISVIRGQDFSLDKLAKELDSSTSELVKAEEENKDVK